MTDTVSGPLTADSIAGAAYIVAALLFILSLAGLSKHEKARAGVIYGITGMVIALAATIWLTLQDAWGTGHALTGLGLLVAAVAVGGAIGLWRARVVEMTGMPELIALLHSFVGLAAVLVGWNGHLEAPALSSDLMAIHHAEVFIGVFIGAVTFTGSIVAFLKLSARMKSSPLMLPGKNAINLGALAAFIALTVWYVNDSQLWLLIVVTVLALGLGWHLVASIGGGDMPVVVSMLNSYSGWAAAAAGFLLNNDLLIITGALVGSSGAYLSYIMCKAMNRSFISVIAGGFGIAAPASKGDTDQGEHREITAEATAEMLTNASSVVITPGYGMAVAQAQYPVAELAHQLREKGRERQVRHPPGRRAPARTHERPPRRSQSPLRHRPGNGRNQRRPRRHLRGPGHRRQRHRQPRRRRRPRKPHRGMPVLRVWEAENVIVFKRSMAAGYAGVQNPLFYRDNSQMLFGDAKQRVEDILRAF